MKRTVVAGSRRIEYVLIQAVRRNILIQALPEGETRVYAPKTARLRDVDELVRASADRIAEMHRSLDQRREERQKRHPVADGSEIMVEGQRWTLRLSQEHCARPRADLDEDAREIRLRMENPGDEEAVRSALKSALAVRALARIRQRIEWYHPRIGGAFGRVTVRDQRSRWGSCSSKHNLNFNWKLILAPSQALDYVVVHELCHLHEFNHSPRFWRLVESQMPDYEAWKKWLKIHGSELGI